MKKVKTAQDYVPGLFFYFNLLKQYGKMSCMV